MLLDDFSRRSKELNVPSMMRYLGHQMVERGRVGIQPFQVRMKGKFRKRFPRWLISLNFQRRHTDRTLMSHGAAGNHGYAMHAAEAQFTTVLK